MNLRTPGPTPCPPQVLEAMARQMIDHRGPEAAALIARLDAGLKRAFRTEHDVITYTTSGSGGLEAAVANTISPGDRVLAVSVGVFGDRFASIAQAYGANVTKLAFEPGQAIDLNALDAALRADPALRAVLVTHNETSTGVTNPLQDVARVVRAADKLLLVDAVSSLSSMPVEVDAWGLDVVVSGSQKGWMIPPGLAFVSFSPRAWEAYARSTAPKFYFDAARYREAAEKGQTPWTPALSLYFALDAALDLLEGEGWENVYARHVRIADHTRRGVTEMGLQLVANPSVASNTVTAVWAPPGIEVSALRRIAREQYGVTLAGGQGSLTGKIFRIGHLGAVTENEIDEALAAVGHALNTLGYRPTARV